MILKTIVILLLLLLVYKAYNLIDIIIEVKLLLSSIGTSISKLNDEIEKENKERRKKEIAKRMAEIIGSILSHLPEEEKGEKKKTKK